MAKEKKKDVRFTMLIYGDQQEKIELHQKDIEKRTGYRPERTKIIRQALDEFLEKIERINQKKARLRKKGE